MEEAHRFVGGVRELDLANYGSVSVVDRINVVQGLRTSAGKTLNFFPFLLPSLPLLLDEYKHFLLAGQRAQHAYYLFLSSNFPIPANFVSTQRVASSFLQASPKLL
jgi:hypothetical protein